ncbi:response regulator transcription factor [Mucilaginibacter gynuensis]|uniref:Response regulator transcription factor n=1 Tax=Mucilaginibacter gynuensis TaxID=1302236 RepID=A0ABP8G489_9SPHI
MVQQQILDDYSPSFPITQQTWRQSGGHFVALRLDDFTHENIAATTVYSRKDFYKISLITGHASYYYLDKEYLIEPGACALIFTNCEVPYRWEVHTGTCGGYSCMFTDDFLPLHTYHRPADWSVFNANGQSVFRLDLKERELFTAMFQKMLAEQASDYPHKYDLLFLYVLECIHGALKLEPQAETHAQTAADRLTEAFKTLLADQFPLVTPLQQLHLRTPQAFADKLAVHTNHLNRALKTVTGKTTTQLLTERIMQEARALLLHSNWSVSQISYSLGFDEPTHFTQAFRKHTGQIPTALRQMV